MTAPRMQREVVGVELPRLKIKMLQITIVGDSPYICHAWSAKARRHILDKQMKRARGAREAKDPEALYLDSLYPVPGKPGHYGVPASALKSAAVDACSFIEGVTKVVARGALHVIGDVLPIRGKPRMREDMVRIGSGTADIRYRGEFLEWEIDVPIRYDASVMSEEQIVNLFNVAGFSVGIGEWRPQSKKGGSHGMFHVKEEGG